MEDITRQGNTEVRPHFRNAGMSSWGPFYWGRHEIQGQVITEGWHAGVILVFGWSISFSATRRI